MRKKLTTLLVASLLVFGSSLVTLNSSLLFAQGAADYLRFVQAFAQPQFTGVLAPAAPTVTAVTAPYTVTPGVQYAVSLTAGTYRVVLTYTDASGDESIPSGYTNVTTTSSLPAIYVTWPGLPKIGVPVSWNVYICSGSGCTNPKLQNSAVIPIQPAQGYYQTSTLLTVTAPPTSNTAFPYSAGSIYSGGGSPTAITATTLTLSGGAYNNCAAPAFSSCGLVYFNGTTIAETSSYATATASGSFPLYAVTQDSSSDALSVVPFSLIMGPEIPVPESQGGLGITSGTSGGVLCQTSTTTIASSVALTANTVPKGGGAGNCPTNSGISDSGTAVTSTETFSPTATVSQTANPAAAGAVRLANTDTINFRNAGNSADVTLGDAGAAASGTGNIADLFLHAAGWQGGAFVDASAAPAQAGVLRTGNAVTAVSARNAAGGANITELASNASNNTVLGDSNGTVLGASGYLASPTANPAASGILRLANTDVIAARNAGNSADLTFGFNTTNQPVLGSNVAALSDGIYVVPLGACGLTLTTGALGTASTTNAMPGIARVAAGESVLTLTTSAAASVTVLDCDIAPPSRTTSGKGVTINSVQLFYGAQTTAFSSITAPTINTDTYPSTGGAAGDTISTTAGGSLTITPGTLGLATTSSGSCYSENIALGTPLVVNNALQRVVLEQIFNQSAGTAQTVQICGVVVNYSNNVF